VIVTVRLGHTSIDARIAVDGVDITRAVTGLTLTAEAGGLTRVTLQLLAEVDLDAEVAAVVARFAREDVAP
jgi:hypothetical protein